jgi:hypothetical protein
MKLQEENRNLPIAVILGPFEKFVDRRQCAALMLREVVTVNVTL